ncbi:spore maturation protein [Limnochorda pilosa]|uniref:Spore maturation protein n=1 Tax=Limnochorda pilosa TaxID=1555112 RepID=A0A0K2SHL8_LIMPI|nr:nucleoside recognition domain-containing protein [Limnochorda pilosa]BAS26611.1 spore maturation protein [Limnochorda pilosa]
MAGWVIPILVSTILIVGLARGVDLLDAFVEGALEGVKLGVRILPFIMAIYVGVGLFQAGGVMDVVSRALGPLARALRLPVELFPLMLIRPFSGGAALGIVADLLRQYGPDSLIGRTASIMEGSSETTFYVLTLYLGAVGVKRSRYALPLCLLGDVVGFVAAGWAGRAFF